MQTTNAQIRKMYKAQRTGQITIQEWWAFLDTLENREIVREVLAPVHAAENRLKDYKNGYYFRTKIRAFCNEAGWTDVYAFEVIKVVSDKTVIIRRLDAKLLTKMEFVAGGFSAHCVNNHGQKYEYSSNPDNEVRTIRKGKKGWGLGRYHMSDTPHEHYDFNF